ERDLAPPSWHRGRLARLSGPLGGIRDLRRLSAVVARVRHEVLQDYLLEVAVLGVDLPQRLERLHALLRRLADADQDAAGERDPQLTGGADRLQPLRRVLGRGALVDDQVRVD